MRLSTACCFNVFIQSRERFTPTSSACPAQIWVTHITARQPHLLFKNHFSHFCEAAASVRAAMSVLLSQTSCWAASDRVCMQEKTEVKSHPMSVRKNSHYAESTNCVVSKLPAGRDAHPSHQFKNMFTRKLLISHFDYIGNPVRWSMHANKSLIFLCIIYNLGFICLKWGVGWITV